MGRQANNELGQHDSAEQIRRCLSCSKPECNNCGTQIRSGRPGTRIIGVKDDGTVVEFESASAAARAVKVERHCIVAAVKRNGITAGYRWRRA